jgi:prevent-host-death family protein
MPATRHRPERSRCFVGIFHAKTHLSQLLDRVAEGEEITITRHDLPVARLVPAGRPAREEVAAIFRQMDDLRQTLPKARDKASLKNLIAEGRRF